MKSAPGLLPLEMVMLSDMADMADYKGECEQEKENKNESGKN